MRDPVIALHAIKTGMQPAAPPQPSQADDDFPLDMMLLGATGAEGGGGGRGGGGGGAD